MSVTCFQGQEYKSLWPLQIEPMGVIKYSSGVPYSSLDQGCQTGGPWPDVSRIGHADPSFTNG